MTFTEAQTQFAAIIDLLQRADQLPVSYAKAVSAITFKLKQLASFESIKLADATAATATDAADDLAVGGAD